MLLCAIPSPSEFWREVLPRALKACFGPRFLSLKLQLLATLQGLSAPPSSAPGDRAFSLAEGGLEGLGNTLSFKLAFRLQRPSSNIENVTSLMDSAISKCLYLTALLSDVYSVKFSTDVINLTSAEMQNG